jgi:hypothetical protein
VPAQEQKHNLAQGAESWFPPPETANETGNCIVSRESGRPVDPGRFPASVGFDFDVLMR